MTTNTPIDRGSDPTKKSKTTLHVRIESDLLDAVKRLSLYNRRTLTAQIHLALEAYVNSDNAAEARRAFEAADSAHTPIDRGEQN